MRFRARLRPLRKLATLSRDELLGLLGAQWALIRAQLLRWTRPVGSLVSPDNPSVEAPADGQDAVTAARLALAVARAAEHGIFRPTCLVRGMALVHLLEARGISGSQLRVGVRWDGRQFAAHAWVEYNGRILGDWEEHVRRFTPLSNVRVLPPGSPEPQRRSGPT